MDFFNDVIQLCRDPVRKQKETDHDVGIPHIYLQFVLYRVIPPHVSRGSSLTAATLKNTPNHKHRADSGVVFFFKIIDYFT